MSNKWIALNTGVFRDLLLIFQYVTVAWPQDTIKFFQSLEFIIQVYRGDLGYQKNLASG